MRIGTNHGSLSDRIMNRFGDTPLGMVESALEFARIARRHDFHNFAFSMKASNPKVMIECYRLLVARLNELGPDWNYPIHLGVTEAGEGEDGRIKSASASDLSSATVWAKPFASPDGRFTLRDRRLPGFVGSSPSLTVAADVGGSLLEGRDRSEPPHFGSYLALRSLCLRAAHSRDRNCGGESRAAGNRPFGSPSRGRQEKVAPKIRPKDDVRPEAVYEDLNVYEIDPNTDFKINCETSLSPSGMALRYPQSPRFDCWRRSSSALDWPIRFC